MAMYYMVSHVTMVIQRLDERCRGLHILVVPVRNFQVGCDCCYAHAVVLAVMLVSCGTALWATVQALAKFSMMSASVATKATAASPVLLKVRHI